MSLHDNEIHWVYFNRIHFNSFTNNFSSILINILEVEGVIYILLYLIEELIAIAVTEDLGICPNKSSRNCYKFKDLKTAS